METNTPHLRFSPEHVDPIKNGDKYVTARYQLEREFHPGERFNLLDEDGDQFATTRVNWTGELTAVQFFENEFDGHRRYDRLGLFLDDLRGYYPNANLGPESMLTVIAWWPGSVEPAFGYDDRAGWSRPPELPGVDR